MPELARRLGALAAFLCASVPALGQVVVIGPELLPQEEAFRISATLDEQRIQFTVAVADEYYLYRGRTSARMLAGGAQLGELELPPGKVKMDEFFGEVQIYRGTVAFTAPLEGALAGSDHLVELVIQGCADYGVCYPPYVAQLAFAGGGGQGHLHDEGAGGSVAALQAPADNTASLQSVLEGGSLGLVLLVFFNAGLLLAFTPCVLPMVPIAIATTTAGAAPGGARAMALGATYVAGMAVVYTLLGVLAASSGQSIQGLLQPAANWLVIALAVVFSLLGLIAFTGSSMLALPSGIATWLSRRRGQAGTLRTALVAGMASAVVISPCVAAPMAGALLFIATTGDKVLGGQALLALALGMGVLPMLCAAGAGSLLPRAGLWSVALRRLMGLLLIALAVWVLGALLPGQARLVAYGVIGAAGMFVLNRLSRKQEGRLARAGTRVASTLLAMGSAVMILGGFTGGTNELRPLAHLGEQDRLEFTTVATEIDYDALRLAAPGRVMEYYYADWCVSCRELEAYTFADPAVVAALDGYELIKVDLTANDAASQRLLQKSNLVGPPAVIVRDPSGRMLARLVGSIDSATLLAGLAQ